MRRQVEVAYYTKLIAKVFPAAGSAPPAAATATLGMPVGSKRPIQAGCAQPTVDAARKNAKRPKAEADQRGGGL